MNSQQGVYMEVPAVRNMAKNFGQISEVLAKVCKVLETVSNALKATAFIGLVGGTALINFIEVVKPPLDEMSRKCAELNQDLSAAAAAYENGDALGATKFH